MRNILLVFITGIVLNAQTFNITANKWHMFGAKEDLNISKFENTCAGHIWNYDNDSQSWKLFTNSNIDVNSLTGISQLDSISDGLGFWVYGDNNCVLDITSASEVQCDESKYTTDTTIYKLMKLDSSGNELPYNSTNWDMVKVVGSDLVFESKSQLNYYNDYKYEDAVEYCSNLQIGNYNNWRLPSSNELKYLLNTMVNDDASYFPYYASDTTQDNGWSKYDTYTRWKDLWTGESNYNGGEITTLTIYQKNSETPIIDEEVFEPYYNQTELNKKVICVTNICNTNIQNNTLTFTSGTSVSVNDYSHIGYLDFSATLNDTTIYNIKTSYTENVLYSITGNDSSNFYIYHLPQYEGGKEGDTIKFNSPECKEEYNISIIATDTTTGYSVTQNVTIDNPVFDTHINCYEKKQVIDNVENEINNQFTRDDTNEIVTDNENNLMWQDDTEAKSFKKDWNSAEDYCSNLILSSYTDWRLPTASELISIVDTDQINNINESFENITKDNYWTADTTQYDGIYNTISFNSGNSNIMNDYYFVYVRCVRENN